MHRAVQKSWCTQFEGSATLYVRNRLLQCSAAKNVASDLASRAIQHLTRSDNLDLHNFSDYQDPIKQAQRWFHVRGFCEALRLMLFVTPFSEHLKCHARETRHILFLCYSDQLAVGDIARVLGLASKTHGLFDERAAEERVIAAYKQFTETLQTFFPDQYFIPGRVSEYYRVFPAAPVIWCTIRARGRV